VAPVRLLIEAGRGLGDVFAPFPRMFCPQSYVCCWVEVDAAPAVDPIATRLIVPSMTVTAIDIRAAQSRGCMDGPPVLIANGDKGMRKLDRPAFLRQRPLRLSGRQRRESERFGNDEGPRSMPIVRTPCERQNRPVVAHTSAGICSCLTGSAKTRAHYQCVISFLATVYDTLEYG
jgi:hypothetical protein